MKLSYEEMYQMRLDGKTYREIGEACGVTRQQANYILLHYDEALKGIRGHGFDIDTIIYKGLYEYFRKNLYESVTSFTKKVYGNAATSAVITMRNFLTGKYKDSRFTVPVIKRICEVTGMSFEEVFAIRDKEAYT